MWRLVKKHILPLLLAVSLCLAFSVTAYARYINELVTTSELTTSDGKAVMYSSVDSAADVTQIKITHNLQKKTAAVIRMFREPLLHEPSRNVGAVWRIPYPIPVPAPIG